MLTKHIQPNRSRVTLSTLEIAYPDQNSQAFTMVKKLYPMDQYFLSYELFSEKSTAMQHWQLEQGIGEQNDAALIVFKGS